MNIDVNVFDLWFRRFLSIITLFFGVMQYIWQDNFWLNAVFVVFMAGVVGYYTNFLAIKMLFQPKQGKVLGWEGLVPKNKRKIAQSLGRSIQNKLLAPDILLNYIFERNLIEIGTQKVAGWIDETLQNEKVRITISTKLVSVLRDKGPDLLEGAFDLSEDVLKKVAQNPEEIKKYWAAVRERIIAYIKSRENRVLIASTIQRVLLEEMPKLSKALNHAIEGYLKSKDTIGTIGISLKKLVSFNDQAIKDLLENFIQDQSTGEQFMLMMDAIVEDLSTKLASPETQDFVVLKFREWVEVFSEYARQNILPAGIDRLQEALSEDKSWQMLDEYSFRVLNWMKNKIMEFMNSPEGQEYIKSYISRVVHQINVTQLVEQQVMKLDTDELEKMILDNTGGNLVMIQVLGGVLGIIAGFIQVNILFSIPVGILFAVSMLAYYQNKKRYEENPS